MRRAHGLASCVRVCVCVSDGDAQADRQRTTDNGHIDLGLVTSDEHTTGIRVFVSGGVHARAEMKFTTKTTHERQQQTGVVP